MYVKSNCKERATVGRRNRRGKTAGKGRECGGGGGGKRAREK